MLIQPPTAQAEQTITALQDSQQPLLAWLANPHVTNSDEQTNAENLLISARYALRQAEEKRKELTGPLDESKVRILALFKPYIDNLDHGITAVTRELGAYRARLLELQQAEQRKAMQDQAARMRQAQETGEVIEPVDALDVPDVAKTSRPNLGTVTYRDDWDIQIVDANKVPRDLCDPSMPRIRARVKSGVTAIPGVLVTRKVIATARAKGGNNAQQR